MPASPDLPAPRILILTAGFGEGHNTAANSIAAALRELSPAAECQVWDLYAEVFPAWNRFLRSAYHLSISRLPALWSLSYRLSSGLPGSPFPSAPVARALAERIGKFSPSAVACTHPFYHQPLAALPLPDGVPRPPVTTVVTDSITIHPLWVRHAGDRVCVPDETTRAVMVERGIDSGRLQITGFPVSPVFARLTPCGAPSPPQHPLRILYFPAKRKPLVRAEMRGILAAVATHRAHLTVVLGRNEARLGPLTRGLRQEFPGASCEILGWTREIPRLLCDHHTVITKAGGAIVNEAIAARCPLILNYAVPGQEEGNAQRVVNEGIGALAVEPERTASLVAELCSDPQLARWISWRAALGRVSHPEAALTIATALAGENPPLSRIPRP